MATAAELSSRMKGVAETRQIAGAMHMISTSKMQKAIKRYDTNRPYVRDIRAALKDILEGAGEITHPFLNKREGTRTATVVIAADKGLCGSYNHNVLEMAYGHMLRNEGNFLITVGRVTREFFESKGMMVDVEFVAPSQNPSLGQVRFIAEDLIDMYRNDLLDRIEIAFTRFVSTFKQEPAIFQLLPLSLDEFAAAGEHVQPGSMIYHPSPEETFSMLVPQYLVGMVYSALVQSYASEHCARMIAMDAAKRNADEMLKKLSLESNRLRQARITREITEIMSGALSILETAD